VQDALITLPPIGGVTRNTLAEDWWTPKNYDGGASGPITLRRALENSKNLVTAQLLSGGIADSPPDSLDQICRLAQEAQLYASCERFYPFVLGAQPVRPVDIAAFYAAIANEGGRPTPHIIDSIEQDGRTIYRASNSQVFLGSADRASVFQLRTMLQGVLARGTARAVAHHWPYIAGKTGTSDDENDAWFVGFSNDVTIAVWVGYDNAKGKRTLGTGQTGGKVSLPIFDTIMQAVWAVHAPKTVLRGPSPDAARFLIALPIDVRSGVRLTGGERGGFLEQFRLDRSGRFVETLYRLVSRENANPVLGMEDLFGNRIATDGYRRDYDGTPFFAVPRFSGATPGYIAPRPRELDDRTPRARRVDPDYFWSTPHRLY